MATIIYQTDKRSGITYAYNSVSYWDKEKKQSRAKRTLIGRLDTTTNEIVPTDGRCRAKRVSSHGTAGRPKAPTTARLFCGATYLLDAIGETLGITADLRACFPDTYRQILSLVYYLVLEDKNPLYRFEKWASLHKHPCGHPIPSQRSSDLFASITEADRHAFFRLQGKRRMDKEYWAYDTTSFSSYSQCLRQVQRGYNKEGDDLPQLNLALVFGQRSNLPFYYRKLAGNIPDGKTVSHLLKSLDVLKLPKVKLVMDRAFYGEDNINALLHDHTKFLVGAKMSSKFVRQGLDPLYDGFRSFEQFSEDYDLYHRTVTARWVHKHTKPRKAEVSSAFKRVYLHYYYNIDQAAEDEKAFDRKIMGLREEILSGRRCPDHEKLYETYFSIHITPKRGIKVTVKEDAVARAKRYYGFFALMTNEAMGALEALETYRNRDVIEKAFGNLKERLNLRRTLVSSEKSLDGKLFVEFVALIYLSHIKKKMQETGLFKSYTMQGLLDLLDVIECFEAPGHQSYYGEILTKQKDIYTALGVNPPTSL